MGTAPNDGQQVLARVETLFAEGTFTEVLAQAEQIVPRSDDDRRRLLWATMRANQRLGRNAEAVALAREAIDLYPGNEHFARFLERNEFRHSFDQVRKLFNAGCFAEALAAAERVTPRTDDNRWHVLWVRMRALHQLERDDEALALAREAIRLFPEDETFQKFLAEREQKEYRKSLALVRTLFQAGKFNEALAAAADVRPRGHDDRRQILWITMRGFHRLGREDDALRAAREAVAEFPDNREFQSFLADRELRSAEAMLERSELDGSAFVDIVADLIRRQVLPTTQLRRIADLVVDAGSAEDLADRISALPDASPAAMLLLGLVRIAQGRQLAGADLCRQALSSGLPQELGEIADNEIAAARFHKIGRYDVASDQALVVVEPNACLDVVRLAVQQAGHVHICAGPGFVPQHLPMLDNPADEQRVAAVKFHSYGISEIAETHRRFAEQFVRLALDRAPALKPLRARGDDHASALVTVFRMMLDKPLRWLFNALKAIEKTGARRVFLVAEAGWLSLPLAAHLSVSPEPFEIQIASASPFATMRATIVRAIASGDPAQAFAGEDEDRPDTFLDEDEDGDGYRVGGSGFIDLLPAPRPRPGKPRCIVCVTGPDGRLPFPLRAVLEPLLPEWDPIVVIAANRRFSGLLAERVRENLGDLLPSVTIKQLDSLSALEKQIPRPELEGALSDLLAKPELARLEFHGVRLAPLLRRFCSFFLWRAAHIARTVSALDGALQAWMPQFMLVQQNYQIDSRFLQLAARRAGVPTLGLQTFLYGRDPRNAGPPAVDRFLCFDTFARDVLAEMSGFPRERITVIGSVRMDAALRQARSYDRAGERAALGVAPDEQLVIVVTQPIAIEENKLLVDLALEALHDLPSTRIVVKLHPREAVSRIAVYQGQVDKWNLADRTLVTKSHDIYRLLAAADLVVNTHSNVGIEAALLDRNVVAAEIDLDLTPDIFSLEGLGLLESARTREDAIRSIRTILTDPQVRAAAEAKHQAFFANNPELRDGRSLERMLAAIRATVAEGPQPP
jgi:tetratricopeptide (TPR) repeat protein